MATLVLTAVGSAIGGPLGSAIGAFVGQQIDRALIGNGPRREGPRLKELEVQTSSYGTAIPAIYGSMRVAGTVIWASDLIEKRSVAGGSKSQPGTATYSYSVNLAVAFSSKPIARVGRIWADGNLLQGAAGDLKFDTKLRIYDGQNDQPLDPLLASSEAPGLAPAHRGLAYAVFEGLQLAEFGNRIPSLTFEVLERESAVPVHEIFNDISGNVISGTTSELIGGYAVQGRDALASIAPLAEIFPLVLRPMDDGLEVVGWFNRPTPIPLGPAVIGLNGKSIEQPAMIRNAKSDEGASISLRYFERERDYQAGLQRYGAGPIGRFETQFELPACLDTGQAQRLAALNWRQQNRSKLKSVTTVPFQAIPLTSAANIASPPNKITEIEYFRGCVRVSSLGWVSSDSTPSANGDPGRDVSAPDLTVGETLLHLIDLPVVSEPLPTQPLIGVIAAGTGQGWRKAALAFHDGSALRELGRTAPPGVIGWLQDPISTHEAHFIDHSNSFRVRVHHDAMDLPPGYGDPLHPDAPLVHIAGEFIKYGDCTQTGPLEFRLSNLVRGCFGSETLAKPVGASLCVLNKESIAQFGNLGLTFERSALFEAHGIGDASPVLAALSAVGRAIQPLPPCHLSVKFDQVQGISINWIRRSRLDTGWRDYADLPFDETESFFEVKLERGQQILAIYEAGAEWLEIPEAVVTAWGLSAGDSVNVSVRQRGANALSAPTSRLLVL